MSCYYFENAFDLIVEDADKSLFLRPFMHPVRKIHVEICSALANISTKVTCGLHVVRITGKIEQAKWKESSLSWCI